jgi:hypothetical protein
MTARQLALLALLLALVVPWSASGRSRVLSRGEVTQVRREIRRSAAWHLSLLEGRRPALRTQIKKVTGASGQYTAFAEITALWRGERTPLVENQFTITRSAGGKLTVSSPRPFLPK